MRLDDCTQAGGNLTDYLRRNGHNGARFKGCDPHLWKTLGELGSNDNRYVRSVQESGILPGDTLYCDKVLHYPADSSRQDRQCVRNAWFQGVREVTACADVVYVDPDIGIERRDHRYRKDGPSHAYIGELRQLWECKKSLVIYQSERSNNLPDLRANLMCGLNLNGPPMALRFCTIAPRWFIVIPQPRHQNLIRHRINLLLASPWHQNGHFEEVVA